jgi:predicted O-methyltransferase YrrM
MRPTAAWRLEVMRQVCGALRQARGRSLRVLEIGSLLGESAKVLAQYGSVTCVDLWDYEGGLTTFMRNVDGLPVNASRGSSVDLLPTLPDAMFDVVYVDGDHTYPIVEHDMYQAKRLIAVGGIVCGDDLEKQLVTDADVQESEAFSRKDYHHDYHPGVSLAVYRVFGRVQEQGGFWWVQA